MKTTSMNRNDIAQLSSARMRYKGAMIGISLRTTQTRNLLTESLPCEEKPLSTLDRVGKLLDSMPENSSSASLAATKQAKAEILSIH